MGHASTLGASHCEFYLLSFVIICSRRQLTRFQCTQAHQCLICQQRDRRQLDQDHVTCNTGTLCRQTAEQGSKVFRQVCCIMQNEAELRERVTRVLGRLFLNIASADEY
ncbi:recombination endonuclease VII domain-containing protein [Pochonia chlamydosporia 170]|uniref:Recombination endonuclease VII domain-containing protein n=1 Tax=Pochonia chlamydosporia 170 TaxID=1380566 RepID=A0A179FYM1_METCM|nr:recombination endonuclease VII domain-containing protein [Pochonia chlamydosporia 170]OAQ70734.1 recombination endonuclease VII domain-containing protein [Pochonia chlamydosporia 170]